MPIVRWSAVSVEGKIMNTPMNAPMKAIPILAGLLLGMSAHVFAAGVHDHGVDNQAAHGGIVVEVGHYDYELVSTGNSLQLHLRDHHGEPMDVSGASAKLTILVGAAKQEVLLVPAGTRFEALGSFKLAGAKVVASVSMPGQAPATVRFALK
jgi:hypothetical protein